MSSGRVAPGAFDAVRDGLTSKAGLVVGLALWALGDLLPSVADRWRLEQGVTGNALVQPAVETTTSIGLVTIPHQSAVLPVTDPWGLATAVWLRLVLVSGTALGIAAVAGSRSPVAHVRRRWRPLAAWALVELLVVSLLLSLVGSELHIPFGADLQHLWGALTFLVVPAIVLGEGGLPGAVERASAGLRSRPGLLLAAAGLALVGMIAVAVPHWIVARLMFEGYVQPSGVGGTALVSVARAIPFVAFASAWWAYKAAAWAGAAPETASA